MDIDELIDDFNSGDDSILKYFDNDVTVFFNFLERRGKLPYVDARSVPDGYQNDFMIYLYQNDTPRFYENVINILGDVEEENGKFYLILSDRGDLASLFCDGRNDISNKTIESLLNGEYDWEPYYDTTDNVYRDVVEVLNDKNLEILKRKLVEELKDIEIEPTTDTLEEVSVDGKVIINDQTISRIIDDEESMAEILEILPDLKSDLYSVHNNSYNNAYSDEIYDEVWNELDDLFVGRGEAFSRPVSTKPDAKMIHKIKIEIRGFVTLIVDFLSSNQGYTNTLEYYSYFLDLLKDTGDSLRTRVPDYPYHKDVDTYINDSFSDYIY